MTRASLVAAVDAAAHRMAVARAVTGGLRGLGIGGRTLDRAILAVNAAEEALADYDRAQH